MIVRSLLYIPSATNILYFKIHNRVVKTIYFSNYKSFKRESRNRENFDQLIVINCKIINS